MRIDLHQRQEHAFNLMLKAPEKRWWELKALLDCICTDSVISYYPWLSILRAIVYNLPQNVGSCSFSWLNQHEILNLPTWLMLAWNSVCNCHAWQTEPGIQKGKIPPIQGCQGFFFFISNDNPDYAYCNFGRFCWKSLDSEYNVSIMSSFTCPHHINVSYKRFQTLSLDFYLVIMSVHYCVLCCNVSSTVHAHAIRLM